jgi:hypothetical protein
MRALLSGFAWVVGAVAVCCAPQVCGAGQYTAPQRITSVGDAKNQFFGLRLALSRDGRTLAVADPWYAGTTEWPNTASGAVYIYRKAGNAWALQVKLEPPDARAYDAFGSDVALSANGDTLAVGAEYEGRDVPYDPRVNNTGPGSVFVYTRSGDAWVQRAYLQSADPQLGTSFGGTVEISASGNVLAVGAPYESITRDGATAFLAGNVYLFKRSQGSWQRWTTVRAPSPQSYDRFGLGLRLSDNGKRLVVFSGEQNQNTENDYANEWGDRNNTLYVFGRAGSQWAHEATIEGNSAEPYFAGDGYSINGEGFDVSGDGNTLTLGSSHGAAPDGGAGYVATYERAAGSWIRSGVTAVPSIARLEFGTRVTLSPDASTLAAVMVNAPDIPGNYGRHSLVIFKRVGSNWSQVDDLQDSTGYLEFGVSVGLSRTGRVLAVGSPRSATETSSGAVLIYRYRH